MRVVFVKHFLNPEGLSFVEKEWFPKVYGLMSRHKGFISLKMTRDEVDESCVNITLTFRSEEDLNGWLTSPDYDGLVDALNPYRLRSWLWAAEDVKEGREPNPDLLEWHEVQYA